MSIRETDEAYVANTYGRFPVEIDHGKGSLLYDTEGKEYIDLGSGIAVTSFTVAVDRDFAPKDGGERETDFIDCVAWRQTGEFVSKYFTKGRMAVVSGRLQIRSWTDKDGNKRRTAEVVADNVYFGDSKRDGDAAPAAYGDSYAPAGYTAPAAPAAAPASDFAMLEDDDSELPF